MFEWLIALAILGFIGGLGFLAIVPFFSELRKVFAMIGVFAIVAAVIALAGFPQVQNFVLGWPKVFVFSLSLLLGGVFAGLFGE